jgi:hypothetical protein
MCAGRDSNPHLRLVKNGVLAVELPALISALHGLAAHQGRFLGVENLLECSASRLVTQSPSREGLLPFLA